MGAILVERSDWSNVVREPDVNNPMVMMADLVKHFTLGKKAIIQNNQFYKYSHNNKIRISR